MFTLVQTPGTGLYLTPQRSLFAKCAAQTTLTVVRHKSQKVATAKTAIHGGKIKTRQILDQPAPRDLPANLRPVQVNHRAARTGLRQSAFIEMEMTNVKVPMVDARAVHAPRAVSQLAQQT